MVSYIRMSDTGKLEYKSKSWQSDAILSNKGADSQTADIFLHALDIISWGAELPDANAPDKRETFAATLYCGKIREKFVDEESDSRAVRKDP